MTSRNAWHVRGFPDVFVGAEEVDECTFLFGGKCGANAHYFAFGAVGVYEDFLSALHRLKRPSRLLMIGCFFGDLLFYDRKLRGCDDGRGMITTFDLALVGPLK